MAEMTVRTTNSTFQSISTSDYDQVDDAYRAGVKAALEIASSEVENGAETAIVEVAVDVVGQRYAARGAVTVATARMLAPSDS
jgi:hypothetical protein